MRGHLKDTVKSQLLINEIEEISPIPCVILHNSMCIKLDPKIKTEEAETSQPARYRKNKTLATRSTTARNREEAIGNKVTH